MMLKKYFLLMVFMMSVSCFSQQKDFIFGQLIDSTQNESIAFATIRIKGKALGVISNIDGTFKIPMRFNELGEILEISCLGYESKEMNIEDLNESESNIIALKPGGFKLNEAIVSANIKRLSAKQIVKVAINSIPQNYPENEFGLVGYYRDYQVKNNSYTNLNEAIIKVSDGGFGKKNSYYNRYQMLSYDENIDFEIDSFAKQPYDYEGFNKVVPNAKMKNDGGNEFIMLGMHDAIRNYQSDSFSYINDLKSDFVKNHRFKLKGKSIYKEQEVYEIDGTFRNDHYLAQVKIFINTEDFAIHKLDYTLFKRSIPEGEDLAINAKERFSDGFRVLSNEILYRIQTEYARDAKGVMFLNYISFYNKILVQRPSVFKSRFEVFLADRSFRIRMNKHPANLNKIKKRDFKINHKGKVVPIDEFYYSEDERTFVVCPNLDFEESENLFELLFTEREDLLVADVKYSYGNIKDNLGNKLDERKWEYLHQYREFFTQETQSSYQEIREYDLMIKTLPLDSPDQPVARRTLKTEYWKNSPLPALKN